MKKVSIIIAIYNVEAYLQKCIDSAIDQSYSNIEIIAVNDGSTDNSLILLQSLSEENSRIVIVDKPNGGLADARNAGMDIATGDYFAFLDGDDTFHPNFVSEMVHRMEKDESDLVCSNYTYCWEGNKKPAEEKKYLEGLVSCLSQEEAISAYFIQKIIGSVNIKMFKRSICDEHSLRFPKGQMWEDMTFTFNYLSKVNKVSILNQSYYNYLQSEISITRKKDSLNILDILKATNDSIATSRSLYPGKFKKEIECYFTKTFIIVLVYSFKCKDLNVQSTLKDKLKESGKNTGFSFLNWQEKMLISLYHINYDLAKWVYFKIHKRNQKV